MAYPVLASFGAVAFLNEPMSPLSVVGVLVTLGGVYLVAVRHPVSSGADVVRARAYWMGVGLAAAAAVSWSCSTLALRPALDLVDVATAAAIRTPAASAVLFVAAARGRVLPKIADLLHGPALVAILSTGVISVAASGFFLISVELAGAGRAAVLNATAPVFAVPLSILLLRERGSPRVVVGTVTSVVGVILLAQR
jgi:drug/metabolite transporter (DMT)-like permease